MTKPNLVLDLSAIPSDYRLHSIRFNETGTITINCFCGDKYITGDGTTIAGAIENLAFVGKARTKLETRHDIILDSIIIDIGE